MKNKKEKSIKIWTGEIRGYRLLDSGEKQKLEEINGVRIIRNEPRVWWQKSLPKEEWQKAESLLPKEQSLEKIIDIGIGRVKAKMRFNKKSKHIGIFPEQIAEWRWMEERVKNYKPRNTNQKLNVLNLFGYTGVVSLVLAQAGAKVTHVDASKHSIDWARENQKLSGLENTPIRWIVDDVVKFLKKELKRKESLSDQARGYDAIIMDPPSYGRGPKGEVWKIEEKLPDLLRVCRKILSDKPLFVIINMYSTELSSISVGNLLSDMMKGLEGKVEIGELAIKPAWTDKQKNSEYLLPMSIFALWDAN